MTEHCYSTVFLVMAPKTWDRLSPEDQKLITDCMNQASLDERALSRKMDKEAITTLESKGMVVTYPDKSLFIERSKPVRDFYSKDFPELAAQIEALAN